jgi:hypothetical protein
MHVLKRPSKKQPLPLHRNRGFFFCRLRRGAAARVHDGHDVDGLARFKEALEARQNQRPAFGLVRLADDMVQDKRQQNIKEITGIYSFEKNIIPTEQTTPSPVG